MSAPARGTPCEVPVRTLVALGDSQTVGIGDPVAGGHRGWARLLTGHLRDTHPDVELLNLATVGATTADVHREQLVPAALARPDIATLLVGVNDALRPGFDAVRVHDDLQAVVSGLTATGAAVLVVRLHDAAALLRLPRSLQQRVRERVLTVNSAIDWAVTLNRGAEYQPLVLDLEVEPAAQDPSLFTLDRLHLNPRGHAELAAGAARALAEVHPHLAQVTRCRSPGGSPSPTFGTLPGSCSRSPAS